MLCPHYLTSMAVYICKFKIRALQQFDYSLPLGKLLAYGVQMSAEMVCRFC